ncbi:MAG: PIG-L family deacetylase [Candidatus Woesearchaeota archaeon]
MADNILVFSAHPDDSEFGMGGTLLKLAKNNNVTSVVLTRGEAGTYGSPEERHKEALEAGRIGGYKVIVLGYEDNSIEYSVRLAKEMAVIIREYKPNTIFVPYHTNDYSHTDGAAHPDHTGLGKTIRTAARFAKFKNCNITGEHHNAQRIIYYMVPKYHKPSFVIDVSDVIEDCVRLWNAHKSQTQLRDGFLIEYLRASRRHIGRMNSMEYAEHFIIEEPIKLDTTILGRI